MRFYLVGGALRDFLLGKPPKDLDLVATGISVEEATKLWGPPTGYFPVWRVGGIEVALPRRERKVGPGYRGFRVELDPYLPVEEELGRRDFTVNALALLVGEFATPPTAEDLLQAVRLRLERGVRPGDLVDPFGGYRDLREGVLRAANPNSFAEDPVRVLRLARFAARYGWRVDPATLELARRAAPELSAEPAERVWGEWEKAVSHDPARFLEILGGVGATSHIAGLKWLQPIPIPRHEENLFEHTVLVVREARSRLGPSLPLVTAALFHDAGKGLGWPGVGHDGPEALTRIEEALRALRAPREVVRVTLFWVAQHMRVWGITRPGPLLRLAEEASRLGLTPQDLEGLALADALGRAHPRAEAESRARTIRLRLEAAYRVLREVTSKDVGLPPGPAFGARLRALRENRLARYLAGLQ